MLGKSKAKYIQSLGQKKHRDEEGRFIAEGPKVVTELIAAMPGMIDEIYAINEATYQSLAPGIEVIKVTDQELERISQLKTPNEVIAIVRKPNADLTPVVNGTISLMLDTIQDPGNMGTIIRIADWFNISQIICSADCADAYNPKVVQASMGSIARVNIFYVDLQNFLHDNKTVNVYAMMLDGEDVDSIGKISEGIIMIGNESKGIRPELETFATKKITIMKKGGAESLNAAVATGIVLSKLV